MKKRKVATITIAALVSSTAFIWADTVKTLKESGTEYVSLQEFSKKMGGKLTEDEKEITLNIGSKKIEVEKSSSFGKVNGEHVPLDTDKVDGYIVPKATKIMKKGESDYLPIGVFKNNNLGNYTVENGVINIGNKDVTTPNEKEDKEDGNVNNNSNVSIDRPSNGNSSNNSTGSGGSSNRPGNSSSSNNSSGSSGSTSRPNNGSSSGSSSGSGNGTGGSGNSGSSSDNSGNNNSDNNNQESESNGSTEENTGSGPSEENSSGEENQTE